MNTKAAFIAIVGRPNVGKSSLLNAFVGEKVAIVSQRPQTTRNRITGIITTKDTQLVFIDTPGMHKPKTRLSEYMVREINESASDVDAAVLVTEAFGDITETERELAKKLISKKIPLILAVNKCDLVDDKNLILPKIALFSQEFSFDHIFPISVRRGEGVTELFNCLANYAVDSPFYFDPDSYTDQPERVIVGEMIREKLLINLRDELPHGIAIEIEQMKERPIPQDSQKSPIIDITAVIYCERDSHKGMVIGKNGAMLKLIGSQARADIEEFLDTKINLQCWVKVREDWRNKESSIRQFGFK